MSEATTEQVAETETEAQNVEQPKPTKPTETVEFWKQKAREQEQRAKANAEAATKLKEFEDRDKTEAEKVSERAKTAEDRATQAESRAMRLEVAFEKGLTPAQAKRLVGATREELEADADELLETFKPAEKAAPAVDLDLGTRSAGATVTDPRSADLAQIEADLKATKRR